MLTVPQPGLTPTLTLTQVAAGESFCLIATSHVDNLIPSSDFCRYLSCRGQPALNGQIIGLAGKNCSMWKNCYMWLAKVCSFMRNLWRLQLQLGLTLGVGNFLSLSLNFDFCGRISILYSSNFIIITGSPAHPDHPAQRKNG